MKATGIVRRIDDFGRIVIPAYAGLVVQAFRRPWCNDSGPVVHSFR